jgi:hypothetical protein
VLDVSTNAIREVISMRINDTEMIIEGKLIKTARIRDEDQEDVENPESFVEEMRSAKVKADFFTFYQRIPETKPKYDYYTEWEGHAVIPIKSYDHWFERQINKNARNAIRRAKKEGVTVKIVDFNEYFIREIKSIYDEAPIRQGKPFPHYRKGFDLIKRENSTFLDRSEYLGAYFNDELIGFIRLIYDEKFTDIMQFISKIKHRNKRPNNALLAKAVEVCHKQKIPYLAYGHWSSGTLDDFKRHNGFEKFSLPRYYIPLTIKGKFVLKFKLHHRISEILPLKLKNQIKELREKWYLRKYSQRGALNK